MLRNLRPRLVGEPRRRSEREHATLSLGRTALELADARSLDNYTIREWVDFDGATYVEHEGEVELLPGIRLLPAPGHTDGHQVVVVETDTGTNVLGGDVAIWFDELAGGATEGQRRVRALEALTWLSHVQEPQIPERRS